VVAHAIVAPLAQRASVDAERLLPPPSWNFDSNRVISAFDAVLSRTANTGFLAIFQKTKPRRIATLDPSFVFYIAKIARLTTEQRDAHPEHDAPARHAVY
jgi:hypothetical protein